MVTPNPENPDRGDRPSQAAPLEAIVVTDSTDASLRKLVHELASLIDGAGRYLGLASRDLADEAPHGAIRPHLNAATLAIDQAIHLIHAASRSLSATTTAITDAAANPGEHLDDIIRHACRVLRPLAQQAGVEINVRLSPDVRLVAPLPVYAVVANGLRNAIQASPRESKVDVVALVSQHADEPTLIIDILDAGSGPPEQISRVFEPAFSTRRNGAGLGLAIARDIVQTLDGTIALERRPTTRGAKLSIRIPLQPEHLLPPQ
jgi:signal transduction histidine kinase